MEKPRPVTPTVGEFDQAASDQYQVLQPCLLYTEPLYRLPAGSPAAAEDTARSGGPAETAEGPGPQTGDNILPGYS